MTERQSQAHIRHRMHHSANGQIWAIEPVAEVQILETANDERTAQESHSSVVGELDEVSDVADEDDRLSEE